MEEKLIAHYGVTENPKLAGYITWSGNLLDFNEESTKGPWSVRSLDHRNISNFYESSDGTGEDAVKKALADGLIRMDSDGQRLYLNIDKWPTSGQFETFKKLVRVAKEITIDFESGHYGLTVKTFRQLETLCSEYCA